MLMSKAAPLRKFLFLILVIVAPAAFAQSRQGVRSGPGTNNPYESLVPWHFLAKGGALVTDSAFAAIDLQQAGNLQAAIGAGAGRLWETVWPRPPQPGIPWCAPTERPPSVRARRICWTSRRCR